MKYIYIHKTIGVDAIATHQTQTYLLSVLTVEYLGLWWWEVMLLDNATVWHSQLLCYSKQTPRSPGASAPSFPVPFSTSTCLPLNYISLCPCLSFSPLCPRLWGHTEAQGHNKQTAIQQRVGQEKEPGPNMLKSLAPWGGGHPLWPSLTTDPPLAYEHIPRCPGPQGLPQLDIQGW